MGKPRGLPKSGGRKKGSKNKVSQSKFEKICQIQNQSSFDPLESLVAIGSDLTVPIELRVSVLKELCQYFYPKKRAVEVQTHVEFDPQIRIILPGNGTSNP